MSYYEKSYLKQSQQALADWPILDQHGTSPGGGIQLR